MNKLRCAVVVAVLCLTASLTLAAERDERDRPEKPQNDWRRDALENMRVAAGTSFISRSTELPAYLAAGFNTLVVYDANEYDESGTRWKFQSEDEIRAVTQFARQKDLPLVIGMAVEPYVAMLARTSVSRPHYAMAPKGLTPNGLIPAATDAEIRERIELWEKYGHDVIVGVFPWYDDVFWQNVDVDRQRHVYRLIKDVAPDWYVFGMIGEFGFNATDDEVARYYDPAAFDHLIVLMYPFNVGSGVTGFPLDNVASSDPDGDMVRYVDRYVARMDERFFRQLQAGQLVLLVGQAFYYIGEPEGHIPRAKDISIMMQRGNEGLRMVSGQKRNHSAAYCCWGTEGSAMVGLSQRSDWLTAVRVVADTSRRRVRDPVQP